MGEPGDGSPLPPRKEAILRAAVKLFRERGYHGTTINDIGSASGVTGPAIYRHFQNKDQVLETAILEMARKINHAAKAVLEKKDLGPVKTLEALVGSFLRIWLSERDLGAVYIFEARHVPGDILASFRRSEGKYRDYWVYYLRLARPELSETKARTMAQAALFMASTACMLDPEIDARQLEPLIKNMAVSAMLKSK